MAGVGRHVLAASILLAIAGLWRINIANKRLRMEIKDMRFEGEVSSAGRVKYVKTDREDDLT